MQLVIKMKNILEKIKTSDYFQIMMVGDSITYGTGSNPRHAENITDPDDENTYTAFFARMLSERLNDKTVVRYDGIYNGENRNADGTIYIHEYKGPITVGEGKKGKITVVRSGIGGNTVARLISRKDDFLGKVVEDKSADLFFIKSGINDSLYHIDGEGPKHAEPDEYGKNLETLINDVKASNPNADIVLMTPTVNDEHTEEQWFGKSQLDPYAKKMKEVAAKYGLNIVDLHSLWMAHLDKNAANHGSGDWLTAREGDFCHPSPKGHEAIAKEMIKTLFGE